jgi:cytochrome c oxidase assembly protein subunit 11
MKRNSKVLLVLVAVAIVMFVFGYANIPLFKRFCSAIGIDLSPNAGATQEESGIDVDSTRQLKVIFTTSINDDLPIVFKSKKHESKVYVGESDKNMYHFVNMSDDTLYFRPVHSVFPAEASKKYSMIECFCFKDMMILPHEEVEVPLVYYFKPSLSDEVTRVTMHYTLFKRDRDDINLKGTPGEFNVGTN